MRFCSIASSSGGNAYLVTGRDGTAVLVDCGVSLRRLEAGLTAFGVAPGDVAGVFMTHEHADHVQALRLRHPFPVRHGLPVFAPAGFWDAAQTGPGLDRRVIASGRSVRLGGLTVTAFPKPHDAAEPVGYLVEDGRESVGMATDLGTVTHDVLSALHGADHLIFESNHDPVLEARSGRPPYLIRRVMGDRGHLSNQQAGQALALLATSRTRTILLAHLSEECNLPELALETVTDYLAGSPFTGLLATAPHRHPSPLYSRDGAEPARVAAVQVRA